MSTRYVREGWSRARFSECCPNPLGLVIERRDPVTLLTDRRGHGF